MLTATLQSPAWCHAMSLTERLAPLRMGKRSKPRLDVDTQVAGRRLQRWRTQAPFATASYFAERLAAEGIGEDEFLDLLGEPIEAVHGRLSNPPAWLATLASAFTNPASTERGFSIAAPPGQEMVGFLDLIEPLINQACERLREGLEPLLETGSPLPFEPATVAGILFSSVPGQLLEMLSRTLVLELHVARLQGQLAGEAAEERFQSFLRRLRQPETALALLQEYPVLARQIMVCLENWVAFSLEFLEHLCADWEAIRSTFAPDADPGVLTQADGSGDTHRHGRRVLVARFSSGFRLVYKPRSMAIEGHFQELLTWLNERGDHPAFRTLRILERSNHGWVEFAQTGSCSSIEEIQRFYERQGGYLALLYALEATDFHFENLIAAGEHPVLIDLEALFHPRLGGTGPQDVDQLAVSALQSSVLRSGLLPLRLWVNAESEGVDLSGLGGVAGQLTPHPVPQWEGAGTDGMRLTRQRLAMAGGNNRPALNGVEANTVEHVEAIAKGFTSIYRLLLQHRDELLADEGPLGRFANDEVRVVLRPTVTYSVLLRESFHPDVLRNALDRDRLFDQLWVEVERLPQLARVIPAECEDLLRGDIPMFITRPAARDVWSSSGQRIPDFLDTAGMALVQGRLQQFGEADLDRQLWLIRASLATLPSATAPAEQPSRRATQPQASADRGRLLAAARAVGDRLERLALRGERGAHWIGLTLLNERQWSLAPLGTDLYDGLPGVALFLAYLGSITGESRYTELAQDTLITLHRQLDRARPHMTSIGGFDGWGGVIYTLTHLAALWNQPQLLKEAEDLVELLPPLVERDEMLDVIGGAAGCIGSLLSMYRCAPSERILGAAILCADRLIAQARPMDQGVGWMTRLPAHKPLAGFSHGAAGMAWALLELASLTGEERFRTTARAAMDYERSLFSVQAGNWLDLRDLGKLGTAEGDGRDTCMSAWCHGAPGIGLARLQSLVHWDDATVRAEIDAALRTTLSQGFGHNHSLCHGDLGNLELLLMASESLDDPRWTRETKRLSAAILESIERDGWLCGTPQGVESPGLMTGLAGIGYQLLRLAEPQRVPSVLALAPPILA